MVRNPEPKNPKILGIEIKTIQRRGPVMLPRVGLFVPSSGDMSAALNSEITKYNPTEYLRLLSILSAFRETDPEGFGSKLRKGGRDANEVLRFYQFRHLVRVLLQSDASWDSGVTPNARDIVLHCEWISNTLCQADRSFLGEAPGDAWALLWRMSYQQFKDLEGNRDFYRSMVIYRKLALDAASRHHYPIKERFKEVTGIELDEFWFLSMSLYGWCLDNRGREITVKVLSRSNDFPGLNEELGHKYLDLVGCSREQYLRNLPHSGSGQPGYEPYNLNPLLKWPLIKIRDGAYLAPSPRDLLERASSGIYYDLMGDDPGHFGAVLGDAFQNYVGLILEGLPGVPQIYPETKYVGQGRDLVTCDWIIVDGDTGILVECKRSAVKALAKVTGDRSRIRTDLEAQHGVVDGVLKLLETEEAISQHCPELEFLRNVRRFYGMVVVLDDFYMPNCPVVREIVSQALVGRGAVLEDRIQFSDVGGLEWLANLLSHPGTSIAEVFRAKIQTPSQVEMDFKNFVPDFTTQILPGVETVPWVPLFNDAHEEFMQSVVARLQGTQAEVQTNRD